MHAVKFAMHCTHEGSPGNPPFIISGHATGYLVIETCLSLISHKPLSQQLVEHIHPRQNMMCLLINFYMQLTLSTHGHCSKLESCLPTNRVRLNKGYFGLRSDLQVPNCNNSPGGGSMPPDHPSYCMIPMAQCKTPQKVNKLYGDMRCRH